MHYYVVVVVVIFTKGLPEKQEKKKSCKTLMGKMKNLESVNENICVAEKKTDQQSNKYEITVVVQLESGLLSIHNAEFIKTIE